MTGSAWLNTDHQLVPGTEIFRAGRCFQLWWHTASHSQTLLRSPKGEDQQGRTYETRIDVLFKPITVMKIRQYYDDLLIRCATQDEADRIRSGSPSARYNRDDRFLILESGGEQDYVVAAAVGWHEDTLGFEEPSAFSNHDPGTPPWARTPLFGVDAGLGGNVATAQELIEALASDPIVTIDRARYRYVYALLMRLDTGAGEPSFGCAGVFLTKSEADKAQEQRANKSTACWVEAVPIGV
jgi:hypothetical protein